MDADGAAPLQGPVEDVAARVGQVVELAPAAGRPARAAGSRRGPGRTSVRSPPTTSPLRDVRSTRAPGTRCRPAGSAGHARHGVGERVGLVAPPPGEPLLRPAAGRRPRLDVPGADLGGGEPPRAGQAHGIPAAPDEDDARAGRGGRREVGLATRQRPTPRRPRSPSRAPGRRRAARRSRRPSRSSRSGATSTVAPGRGVAQTLKPRARSCSRPSSVILSGPHGGIQTQLIRTPVTRPSSAWRGLVLDDVGQRAGRGRQGHVDDGVVVLVDGDAVDEAEVDDVDAELGVDDVAQRLLDVRDVGGAAGCRHACLAHGLVRWSAAMSTPARANASVNAVQPSRAHLTRAGYLRDAGEGDAVAERRPRRRASWPLEVHHRAHTRRRLERLAHGRGRSTRSAAPRWRRLADRAAQRVVRHVARRRRRRPRSTRRVTSSPQSGLTWCTSASNGSRRPARCGRLEWSRMSCW